MDSTINLLLSRVKKEFPSFVWDSFYYNGEGWDNHVIIFDEKIVFRFPKQKEYNKEFKAEIKFLNFFKNKTSIKIPDYKFLPKKDIFGGYELIVGKQLSYNAYHKFSLNEKRRFVNKIASFLSVLHGLNPGEIFKFNPGEAEFDQVINCAKFRKEIEKYVFSKLKKNEISVAKNFLVNYKKILTSIKKRTLVHKDLSTDHIIVNNNKISGIIDFTDQKIADPAIDFAGLWECGGKLVKQVYNKYSGAKDDYFIERSKMYFKRAAFTGMLISLKNKECPVSFNEGHRMFKKRFKIN